MSIKTISEIYFEKLCIQKNIPYSRIPESTKKAADYFIYLNKQPLVVEIKQLDYNDQEKKLLKTLSDYPGCEAPTKRVQGLLKDGYPQIKNSSEGIYPSMIVIYNNAGIIN